MNNLSTYQIKLLKKCYANNTHSVNDGYLKKFRTNVSVKKEIDDLSDRGLINVTKGKLMENLGCPTKVVLNESKISLIKKILNVCDGVLPYNNLNFNIKLNNITPEIDKYYHEDIQILSDYLNAEKNLENQTNIYTRERCLRIWKKEKYLDISDDLGNKHLGYLRKILFPNDPEKVLKYETSIRFMDSRCNKWDKYETLDVLVVENTDIFRTIEGYFNYHSWTLKNHRFQVIMNGNGNAINNNRINQYISNQFIGKTVNLYYCGDLDVAGLNILFKLEEIYLGVVFPCYDLYNLMINESINFDLSNAAVLKPNQDFFSSVSYINFEKGIDNKKYLCNILKTGNRIAQETININVLCNL